MDIFEKVKECYNSFLGEKRIIGKSLFGREIFAMKIGAGTPTGIYQYAIHGREYITALLALKHIEQGLEIGEAWIVPLVNPDGAMLSAEGISTAKDERAKKKLIVLNGKEDFSLWKANGRGVDLNVNFDADWGMGSKNVLKAGSENYIGQRPFSEPETRALKKFTEEIHPDYTVSYHTKGEEIYWYYWQPLFACVKDKRLATAIAEATGYKLSHSAGSAGGYKDWCIKKREIAAFTIEAGREETFHPCGEEELSDMVQKNGEVVKVLSETYRKIVKQG